MICLNASVISDSFWNVFTNHLAVVLPGVPDNALINLTLSTNPPLFTSLNISSASVLTSPYLSSPSLTIPIVLVFVLKTRSSFLNLPSFTDLRYPRNLDSDFAL